MLVEWTAFEASNRSRRKRNSLFPSPVCSLGPSKDPWKWTDSYSCGLRAFGRESTVNFFVALSHAHSLDRIYLSLSSPQYLKVSAHPLVTLHQTIRKRKRGLQGIFLLLALRKPKSLTQVRGHIRGGRRKRKAYSEEGGLGGFPANVGHCMAYSG